MSKKLEDLKVAELRNELEELSIDPKGLKKPELQERLKEALRDQIALVFPVWLRLIMKRS